MEEKENLIFHFTIYCITRTEEKLSNNNKIHYLLDTQ